MAALSLGWRAPTPVNVGWRVPNNSFVFSPPNAPPPIIAVVVGPPGPASGVTDGDKGALVVAGDVWTLNNIDAGIFL